MSGTIVVTADPEIAKLATLFDARVVGDTAEAGVNAAVLLGLQALDAASAAVVVPADVPFATAADMRAVIGELGALPDRAGAGAVRFAGPMRWRCAGRT